ncbi:MAG: ribonuclease Y [Planctomycetota bacterium]
MANLIATGVVSALAGIAMAVVYFKLSEKKRVAQWEEQRNQILQTAREKAENERDRMLLGAKESCLQQRQEIDAEASRQQREHAGRQQKWKQHEERLRALEASLRENQTALESKQTRLHKQMQAVDDQRAQLTQRIEHFDKRLETVSGLSREAAVDLLLNKLSGELEAERGAAILKHKKNLEQRCDQIGREILLTSIQRYASTYTADSTTGTVDVPTDDMKGRIIGREGRNIRTFEKLTGVDVIIDDTPGVVIVSAFDPVRREIARLSLEKLIADGRIHPTKIEEIAQESEAEIQGIILTKGREAADEVGVHGLNDRLIAMLGRLHFRSSYSQNVLRHSIEVAFIAGLVAEMLGMDAVLARRCGLLHDIGKAADHELEGGHPKIGADLLRRCGESDEVVHAAAGHHDDIVIEHPYTMLTAIGDACSASRPGARRESLERYVKRMEELESIAKRFDGVRQAFAVSAGRELRVMVSSQQTSDEKAAEICREIAQALESELTYPGEIKVHVLRESRFSEVAR